jgi:CheY-like chemotaxis protein
VALTASASKEEQERALVAGCDGYISKPIDTRAFPQQILQFLPDRSV